MSADERGHPRDDQPGLGSTRALIPAEEGAMFMTRRAGILAVFMLLGASQLIAQQNRVDGVTPMAPELAAYGPLAVGVRTITATDRNRVDVLSTVEGGPIARYDRTLTIEVWYPAALAPGQTAGGVYHTVARDPARPTALYGRAVRDAAAATSPPGGYPLIIVSHGYPGNRYLLSHLAENLASKGFVVAAPDHPDSTYADQKPFASTLYNRPYDQLFVLEEVDRLSRTGSGSFLAGLADVSRTGIIGYSMGGYGVMNTLGAGFSDASVTGRNAPPNRLLYERAASNPAFSKQADRRIKAAIAIAPYGGALGTWNVDALGAITTPVLFVAGSADDIVGYETGVRALYLSATRSDRYLLTFLNGSHNVAAPIPAPAEAWAYSDALKAFPFMHYEDGVWDSVRSNNVLQHFATVFLSIHLKGEADKQTYLDLVPRGSEGKYSVERDGTPRPDYTYWKGFKPRTATGLMLEHLPPGK
jgi:predicted dienelactone hydrolase